MQWPSKNMPDPRSHVVSRCEGPQSKGIKGTASDRFNQLQAQISTMMEKLKTAADYGKRRELLMNLRKLIADLEREVQDDPRCASILSARFRCRLTQS